MGGTWLEMMSLVDDIQALLGRDAPRSEDVGDTLRRVRINLQRHEPLLRDLASALTPSPRPMLVGPTVLLRRWISGAKAAMCLSTAGT